MSTMLPPPVAASQQNGQTRPGADLATTRNKILALVPSAELETFLALSELITVKTREILFKPQGSIDHVHFPEDCVVSLVTYLEDGSAVEAMTVGNDGFCAIAVLNGVESMNTVGIGQVTGTAWRIRREDFEQLLRTAPEMTRLLHRYNQLVFDTVSQSAACNRMHDIEQRCARWLLMSHDRVGRSTFDLTHQFIAQMLGVRRAGVTVALGTLTRRGTISHCRGSITVLDRAGLEAISCECYSTVRRREAMLLG